MWRSLTQWRNCREFSRARAGSVAVISADDQLRYAVMQAERFQDRLCGALIRRQLGCGFGRRLDDRFGGALREQTDERE